MPPGCWLRATQPAADGAGAVGLREAGATYIESSASVATLASISSIASTSAAAMAALRARPYSVAPFMAASAPPTPHPHAANSTSTARTAPATPMRRRIINDDAERDVLEMLDLNASHMEESQPYPKSKSQRIFWRKALRRVFQRRK
ncbi:uncharacterized protein LOC121404111 [Drosophila obscura]|uniref:uncharacterized protein LOC121404111 n=1 Tax=Drosophila obscura TaxID=7282 RepID=UPI001BB255FA|nr:uncharacterized protein LOC121404111 [Drosophila obscura]